MDVYVSNSICVYVFNSNICHESFLLDAPVCIAKQKIVRFDFALCASPSLALSISDYIKLKYTYVFMYTRPNINSVSPAFFIIRTIYIWTMIDKNTLK